MAAKIEVRNLTKVFNETIAVNTVNFAVQEAEVFVIMGLSGSGKSTILRCLNRLIEPDSGGIYLDGHDIMKLNASQLRLVRQKKMSMVFQQFALLPHRTVLQNAAFGLEVQGMGKEEREEKAKRCLAVVGLREWGDAYPGSLSGGMKQRVGLARALANDTDVILMDEAFSALDPLIRQELQDELLNLQRTMNKTIIFITHDFDEAIKIGNTVAFLKDGSLMQVGTPKQIIDKPANEYVARFIKSSAVPKGEQ